MDRPISVSQLSNYIKEIFAHEEMLFNISIFGELTGLSNSRGVSYFSVKDEFALLNCVCFDDSLLKDISIGDQVLVRGTLNYYSKAGKLTFSVNKIEPYGQGNLFLKFIALKEKLEKEGLFDNVRKKSIPENIKNIGIATSETGAVFHDIINVTSRRDNRVNLFLAPCRVQGLNAEIGIAKSLELLDKQNFDVIVLARGGGSQEDLEPFNTELLVRVIAEMKTPVISAVGHETDFTLVDFVSDLRAPTPSAAAELITKDLNSAKDRLKQLSNRLPAVYEKFISSWQAKIYYDKRSLYTNYSRNILSHRNWLDKALGKFKDTIKSFLNEKQYNLNLIMSKLDKLNPRLPLSKGYIKVEQNGKSVVLKSEIEVKDDLTLNFADGELFVKVKE